MRRAALMVSLAVLSSVPAAAQIPAGLDSMLHKLYASRDFAGARFGPSRWIEGGTAYTTVEPSAGGKGDDIVRYETATGARSILVSAKQMTPGGANDPLDFDDYTWSADASKLLLFTNTKKVWRANTRGDYWVLDRKSGNLSQLGGGGEPSTLMYAKFSPAGDRVAYVRHGDVYVESLADHKITQLTTGADSLHVSGMTDWVYEEEFGLRDGFRWSPDGAKIAFWHFDMTGVRTFYLINDTDSLYPYITPIQYPKAGTTNSAVTAGVVSASGGNITWLQLPGDPRQDYLPRMDWVGPNDIILQRMNRAQQVNRVMMANATTGAVTPVLTEQDSAWVDLDNDIVWINGGKDFLWTSERDGWRHVYRVSRAGTTTKVVTNGPYDITGIEGVDEKGGWLYFGASPDNATQRYMYRTKLDGSGKAERVTPASQSGSNFYNISPDAKWALHIHSSTSEVPTTELIKLPSHQTVRVLVDNARLAAAVKPYMHKVEFFKAPLPDGATLDGWMIKPANFDSTKAYPVLLYVYGEPAGQTVQDGWQGNQGLWYGALADQGYIIASVDNRGTPAPRGRAWRKAVYGHFGVLSSQEQADAVRVMGQQHKYVDMTRIGVWGWSGGGSSTLNDMTRHGDVFSVGMAVAPVADPSLYDTIYQERYMGTPQEHPDWYRVGTPANFAEGLTGHLLVMHGSGDDNVHYQGTERFLNRLIALDKPVDFMVYPNRTHCICEGRGTTLYVYTTLTRYLLRNLPAGGR